MNSRRPSSVIHLKFIARAKGIAVMRYEPTTTRSHFEKFVETLFAGADKKRTIIAWIGKKIAK
jgi:hypothetical protein